MVHGASSVPSRQISVADVGKTIVRALERRGFRFFDLVGLSFGGAVAQTIAAQWPHCVRRLVVACTALNFGDPLFWHDRASAVRQLGMSEVTRTSELRWFTSAFARRAARTQAHLVGQFASTRPRGYAACCDALAGFDGARGAREVVAPTLVITGSADQATTTAQARNLRGGINGATLTVIEGGAHLCNVELFEPFNAAVAAHLELPS